MYISKTKTMNFVNAHHINIWDRVLIAWGWLRELCWGFTLEIVRRRTCASDVILRVAELKWSWVEYVARQSREPFQIIRVVLWRPRVSTKSRGKPQKRWIADIKEEVCRSWFWIAQDRQKWKTRRGLCLKTDGRRLKKKNVRQL